MPETFAKFLESERIKTSYNLPEGYDGMYNALLFSFESNSSEYKNTRIDSKGKEVKEPFKNGYNLFLSQSFNLIQSEFQNVATQLGFNGGNLEREYYLAKIL
ncbi:MAG: hypothetical protein SFT90_07525 [Rickettsiales bacterium]|nr:hypothetical protein [Rickettsiales bacterium]